MQTASKSLMDSLNEMYESGWLGHELLYTQSQSVEMLWNDFSHKLADQVLIPMNTYQAQFPEMRVRLNFNSLTHFSLPLSEYINLHTFMARNGRRGVKFCEKEMRFILIIINVGLFFFVHL